MKRVKWGAILLAVTLLAGVPVQPAWAASETEISGYAESTAAESAENLAPETTEVTEATEATDSADITDTTEVTDTTGIEDVQDEPEESVIVEDALPEAAVQRP